MFLQYSKDYHPATFSPSEPYERPSQSIFVKFNYVDKLSSPPKKVSFFLSHGFCVSLKIFLV